MTAQLTSSWIAETLKLQLTQNVSFSHITYDSRHVQPGALFVALPDGHRYITSALEQGASGILYQEPLPSPLPQNVHYFHVPDSLRAYRQIAAAWRKQFNIPVVVIAGSVGKTTTKELLAMLLQAKWPHVLKTEASQNGFIGIPMTLLKLNEHHQAAVIEVGIDAVGAMEQHLQIIQPTAAVLTALGPEHLEFLKDLKTVIHEETLALTWVAQHHGFLAINLNDPWIKNYYEHLTIKTKTTPFLIVDDQTPQPTFPHLQGQIHDSQLTLTGMNFPSTTFTLPLPGQHNANNLLAALAIAIELGLTPQELQTSLSNFQTDHLQVFQGRSRIVECPQNIKVICDYYNAQPASMIAGLELLASNPTKRWVCLGDMLELGMDSEFYHRQLAQKIIQLDIEGCFLHGPAMNFLYDELKKVHYSGDLKHFQNLSELSQALHAAMQPGDSLLIKGSRGMKMDQVWLTLQKSWGPLT